MKRTVFLRSTTLVLIVAVLFINIPVLATSSDGFDEVAEENIIDLDVLDYGDIKTMFTDGELTDTEYIEVVELKKMVEKNKNISTQETTNMEDIEPMGAGTFITVNYIIIKKIAANKFVRWAVGAFTAQVAQGVFKAITGGGIDDHIADWLIGKKSGTEITVEVDDNINPIRYNETRMEHVPYSIPNDLK